MDQPNLNTSMIGTGRYAFTQGKAACTKQSMPLVLTMTRM